jgi:hypothetical protein
MQPVWYGRTPHIKPAYGISYDPNERYDPAPFVPVHYSRWLAHTSGALYVVRSFEAVSSWESRSGCAAVYDSTTDGKRMD